jgi:type VI secretion system protein ImpG
MASHATRAKALLRLELRSATADLPLGQLAVRSLRFFLKGQGQHVFPLYELLFRHVLGVVVASAPRDPEPVPLAPEAIQPVGFARDEGALPYPPRSFLGYRLLTEYFAFAQKFLFFDLSGLGSGALTKAGRTVEIRIYLDRSVPDVEQNLTADTFRLGCTPIVNLFPLRAEPIALTHTETEYRVVPDARHPGAHEVFSIDHVTATSPDNERVEYQPFYSFKHAADRQTQRTFWHAVRRPAALAGGKSEAFDTYVSLVDTHFSPSAPAGWTLDIETTCLDGDRPRRVISVEGESGLRLTKGAPVTRVECLTEPTRSFRPASRRGALWRLISHLSLNHLSLADEHEGAHALREILRLYDFADSAETQSMIEGVLSVRTRRVVGRAGGLRGGVCRGLEVTIDFDESRFVGSGLYLFASVLERFLGLYASVNSFSKLVATTKKGGEPWRWPPRAGETVLL